MDVYTTEDQQVEAIKKWWQENAVSTIFGLVLGLGAIFGWRYWQDHEQTQAQAASRIYQKVIVAIRDKEYTAAEESANLILTDHANSQYATFSLLMLAKIAVDEDKLDTAAEQLQTALDKNKNESIAHLIRIRLARVLLAQEKVAAAAGILAVKEHGDFAASYEELSGDINVLKGDMLAARHAYETALEKAKENQRDFTSIEIKLNNIGQ